MSSSWREGQAGIKVKGRILAGRKAYIALSILSNVVSA